MAVRHWLTKDKTYDLTVIAHVEPLDFGNSRSQLYYWGYEVPQVQRFVGQDPGFAASPDERNRLMGDACAWWPKTPAAYLYQPTWITVANARLRTTEGCALFANDLAALSW